MECRGIPRKLSRRARRAIARHDRRMLALLVIAVFVSAMVIDFAETRYVLAVERGAARDAATWSVVMYGVGCLGFVAVLNVSLWLMIPEGLGFYCGTRLALRRRPCRS